MLSLITDISKKISVQNPKLDAELLLCYVLKVKKEDLLFSDIALTKKQEACLNKLIERRNSGEPLEYILEKTQFYGFDFLTTPDVLIPRSETELLVSLAIEILPENGKVLDMGAGSGCIGISIALTRSDAQVHAIEKSKKAIELIEKNSQARVEVNNFSFERVDVLNFTGGEFDIIVSNPPYVSYLDHLDDGVKNYEPWEALFSGMSGFECIERWSKLSYNFLKPDGFIFFEIGYGQEIKGKEIFKKNGFYDIEIIKDYSGTNRIIKAKKLRLLK